MTYFAVGAASRTDRSSDSFQGRASRTFVSTTTTTTPVGEVEVVAAAAAEAVVAQTVELSRS